MKSPLRARLLALVLGLACAPSVLAEPLPFIGRWLLEDQPDAIYPILTIEDGSMRWHGPKKSDPGCAQEYLLQKERPGTVYVNGRGTRFVAGAKGSFPTYLLKLRASTCGSIEPAVRISFPLAYDKNHMELVEYLNGKPISSRRFLRKK